MTSKIVVNNIESDSGISSVTFTSDIELGTKNLKGHNLESTGIVTAVSFTGSGANLTNLPAGNLSGALPAISGANLTGINTAFGSGTSVNTTGIITATAFVPTSQGALSNRNLIINGAMQVAHKVAADSMAGQSVNLFSNTSNELFLTGVQLEVGSVATPFEHRSEGEELIRCQRYFYKMTEVNYIGNMYYASYCASNYQHPVKMRAAPTITATSMHININPGDTSISSISPTTTQLGLINCANSTAVIGYPLRGQITATAEL
jgi:hypothetical protein